MAQEVSPQTEMAQARQSDVISVIFDQRGPASSRCRSRSRGSSGSSHTSRRSRSRGTYRGRHRSSSSSSSSRSTSRSSRSRSHPRCHRHSSRCRCRDHHRYSRGYRCHSPPRRYRAHSRSYSPSPYTDRSSHWRHYRSRSRSPSYSCRYSRVGKYRCQFSRSPPRSFRGRPRPRSSERSIALSVEEKRQLLNAAKENAMKMLGVERLELPESVKPILSEESARLAGPVSRVRRYSENTTSQSAEVEHDDASSPKLSPKRRMISFSVNNSVAKPTAAAASSAKVTSLVDSVESRKPYGHWIPVKSVISRH